MKKFKVEITNSGIFIFPNNGRKIRTPAVFTVDELRFNEYRVQFLARGLQYKILEVSEVDDLKQEMPSVSKRVIIEELTASKKKSSDPPSFLDKLISENEKADFEE